ALIIVGGIRPGEVRMHSLHAMIDTIYPVQVSETVKGDARSVVKVRIPGGRVTFDDGTVAEVRTPSFALRLGDTYMLFLLPAPTGVGTDPSDVADGVQVLSAGTEGVVDVSTGRTQSLASPDHVIRGQLDGRDVAGFINEIRALAHRGR